MPLRVNSCFRDLLLEYRDLKLSIGIKDVSIDRYISYFDDFICKQGVTTIKFTKDMAQEWVKQRNSDEGYQVIYTRINFSINFLEFLKNKGYDVEIPRRLPHKKTKFTAHIFTDNETKLYFEYVDSFKNIKDPMTGLCVPIIFRIQYGCGTRINETLNLKVKDVDLANGILHLTETKNGLKRDVPVSNSLKCILVQYASKVLYLKHPNDYFFSHIDGRPFQDQGIYHIHRKALEFAEIPYLGGTKGPRLHDWRHTMAVKAIEQFEKNGCDVTNTLPILKTYLGHRNVHETEKYLQLVESHFDVVLDKTYDTELEILEVDKHER